MGKFRFEVIETRTHTVHYTVEAEDMDEALLKAERGDTVEEEEVEPYLAEVVRRSVNGVLRDA